MPLCAIALVLLLDVSGSVSAEQFTLQRDGTAIALRQPAVARAAADGLAVTVIAFGTWQHVIMPWRLTRDAADLDRLADALAEAGRPEEGSTNVAGAITAATAALDAPPCEAERRVTDISGDGRHTGPASEVGAAVADAITRGIEINALPITEDAEDDVAGWYRQHVTGPAGGFTLPATWQGFRRSISAKLAMEIAARE